MADQQPQSNALWLLGGIGLLGLVAYLAMRTPGGNTLQPTASATQNPTPTQAPSTTTDTSGNGVSTNTQAFDMTALSDPLLSIPASEFGGTPLSGGGMTGAFVQTPSGTVVPWQPGIDYMLGSVIHYADGTVQLL